MWIIDSNFFWCEPPHFFHCKPHAPSVHQRHLRRAGPHARASRRLPAIPTRVNPTKGARPPALAKRAPQAALGALAAATARPSGGASTLAGAAAAPAALDARLKICHSFQLGQRTI